MGDLPEEFGGVPLLLERIGLRVGFAQDRQCFGLDLILLALPGRLDQDAFHTDAAPRGEAGGSLVAGITFIDHYLQVLQSRAVGDLNERDRLGRTSCLDPTLDQNLATGLFLAEDVFNLGALHQRLP